MPEGLIQRLNAALEGRYRIEQKLGEGGMATVYLADDLRHERKVALKVLKSELAAVVGAERFLSEIKTTANLQHPHILPLFDSGQADGFLFYVMPHVDGESLRERLDRERQLPVDEAVRIATNVAEALDYAHGRGVIHRDIKPANILLQAGKPVVADFGIALAVSAGSSDRLTETGLSVGTPHYMSPEQATGDAHVGSATDVYALGCVLYEMLVGEPPYTGSTPQAILGKILQSEPASATEQRRTVPPHVDAAIRKALERVPADRFSSGAGFAAALADASFRHGVGATASAGSSVGAWNRLSVVLAAVAAGSSFRAPPPAPVTRQVLSNEGWEGTGSQMGRYTAIAPDGSSMILRVGASLGLKLRGATDVVPIQGTEGARDVRYSPDGQWIVYAIGLDLIKRPIAGGPPVRLADDAQSTYLALDWSEDGTIYYEQEPATPTGARPIVRISSNGGEPVPVFNPEEVMAPAWVRALPDGRGLLVIACPGTRLCEDRAGLYVVDGETGSYERALDGVGRAWYVPTGHIVYVDLRGAVFARAFDLRTLELEGNAILLFEGVRVGLAWVDMQLAENGTVLYVDGGGSFFAEGAQLFAVDLEGRMEPLALPPRELSAAGFGWSRDGRYVVFESGGHIYTYDLVLNTTPTQITDDGGNENPVLSPDGTRLAFQRRSVGGSETEIFVQEVAGGGPARSIAAAEGLLLTDWPTDSLLFFIRPGRSPTADLWIADVSDPERPSTRPYLTSEAAIGFMILSPDGAEAAYTMVTMGPTGAPESEIHLRSFPDPGPLTVVAGGGGQLIPIAWSRDGTTFYYGSMTPRGGMLLGARIERSPQPRVVATDTLVTGIAPNDVAPMLPSGFHPDRGLLFARPVAGGGGEPARPPRVVLIENFFEELRERVER